MCPGKVHHTHKPMHTELSPTAAAIRTKQSPSQSAHLDKLGYLFPRPPTHGAASKSCGGTGLAELLKPLRFMFFLSDPFGSKSAVDELCPQLPVF